MDRGRTCDVGSVQDQQVLLLPRRRKRIHIQKGTIVRTHYNKGRMGANVQ